MRISPTLANVPKIGIGMRSPSQESFVVLFIWVYISAVSSSGSSAFTGIFMPLANITALFAMMPKIATIEPADMSMVGIASINASSREKMPSEEITKPRDDLAERLNGGIFIRTISIEPAKGHKNHVGKAVMFNTIVM